MSAITILPHQLAGYLLLFYSSLAIVFCRVLVEELDQRGH
jgi:hypothetical protein